MNLTVREASPLSDNAFILYNNCPAALYDAETTKHSKVFLAVYKCSGAILPNGSAKATTGFELLTEVPAFSQLSYNIQRESNYPLRLGFVRQIELRGCTVPGC